MLPSVSIVAEPSSRPIALQELRLNNHSTKEAYRANVDSRSTLPRSTWQFVQDGAADVEITIGAERGVRAASFQLLIQRPRDDAGAFARLLDIAQRFRTLPQPDQEAFFLRYLVRMVDVEVGLHKSLHACSGLFIIGRRHDNTTPLSARNWTGNCVHTQPLHVEIRGNTAIPTSGDHKGLRYSLL